MFPAGEHYHSAQRYITLPKGQSITCPEGAYITHYRLFRCYKHVPFLPCPVDKVREHFGVVGRDGVQQVDCPVVEGIDRLVTGRFRPDAALRVPSPCRRRAPEDGLVAEVPDVFEHPLGKIPRRAAGRGSSYTGTGPPSFSRGRPSSSRCLSRLIVGKEGWFSEWLPTMCPSSDHPPHQFRLGVPDSRR